MDKNNAKEPTNKKGKKKSKASTKLNSRRKRKRNEIETSETNNTETNQNTNKTENKSNTNDIPIPSTKKRRTSNTTKVLPIIIQPFSEQVLFQKQQQIKLFLKKNHTQINNSGN